MSKITLDVNKDDVNTVLTILKNLKEGLIKDIKIQDSTTELKTTYKPKTKEIIKENEPTSGKYLNADAFKQKLRAKK